jgi:iron complex transport system substrate-binding protein
MKYFLLLFLLTFINCKNNNVEKKSNNISSNSIKYAQGFTLNHYKNYTKLVIKSPWKNADKDFTYILKEKNKSIPDSLKNFQIIEVPIQKMVATSTTHIPALELLEALPTLIGFSGLNYISSPKTRARIDAKQITEIGNNESLNTEILLSLQPDLVMAFGVDGSNKALENLQKNGLKVLYNGDWLEENPLGKAEWIKLFGALYLKNEKANEIFKTIETNYQNTQKLALKNSIKPTIMSGAMYQNVWYCPAGNSWMAYFFKDANANYIFANEIQNGSLSLPFETVLKSCKNADFWIGTSQFTSFSEMKNNNENYKNFKSFQTKKVYTTSLKKGTTDGIIFYETASQRPDLVLKDLVYILHQVPKNHQLVFFDPLNE